MTIVLNTAPVADVFQPEFTGLFFLVLGNGKTWILTILGSLLALIPDFLYANIKFIYYPDDSVKLMKSLKYQNREIHPTS